ncbi:MAG: nuclear transport factor 2 family protein [Vicinamibacterales bacterium]
MKKLLPLLLLVFVPTLDARQATPQSVVDELLAADRAFSVASSKSDVVNGLTAMFDDDIMLMHAGGVARGRANAAEALRQNKANAGARIEWTPLRAAVSGDGRHGFTAGFMNLRTADGKETPLKYLAYWQKQAAGWRVTVYKRGQAKAMPPLTPMANVLPAVIVQPTADAALIEQYRKGLADAETAFSNDAQTMGIGPAFTKYGSPDAINLGPPDVPVFIVGNDRIGVGVGGGSTAPGSPVTWGPDLRTIVAASGDFGVTIGHIVPNAPGANGKPQPGRPFFTIWHRANPSAPWRYIAE